MDPVVLKLLFYRDIYPFTCIFRLFMVCPRYESIGFCRQPAGRPPKSELCCDSCNSGTFIDIWQTHVAKGGFDWQLHYSTNTPSFHHLLFQLLWHLIYTVPLTVGEGGKHPQQFSLGAIYSYQSTKMHISGLLKEKVQTIWTQRKESKSWSTLQNVFVNVEILHYCV